MNETNLVDNKTLHFYLLITLIKKVKLCKVVVGIFFKLNALFVFAFPFTQFSFAVGVPLPSSPPVSPTSGEKYHKII